MELVCVSRLLRMSVCGSAGGGEALWELNGLPWEYSAENYEEGGEVETKSLIL